MTLSERDKSLIWHPFTQEKDAPLPLALKGGKGSYLVDEQDNEYLDLVSSWWVNLHGHAEPHIAAAIHRQSLTLEHAIFAGFTHEPAVKLCESLHALLPRQLSKFFFSDNGSTSVEVALKMAYQYWRNRGAEKRNFLSFDGAYHGDTFGAMSAAAGSRFHDAFRALCFDVQSVPYAATWPGDADVAAKERGALEALEARIAAAGDTFAALVVEPLIQCAGGMRMCRPDFVRDVVALAGRHNILVIFDEVAVGFGRTGSNFALEAAGVVPDFVCLSKGITGGFLPLAVTVTRPEVYDAFLGDGYGTAFLHGHSYTANPLGCAAALASLELLRQPRTKRNIERINEVHLEEVQILRDLFACVKHARVTGTVAAFELQLENVPLFVQHCLERKIILRPLGQTVYLMPPYCTSTDDLRRAYSIIRACINLQLTLKL